MYSVEPVKLFISLIYRDEPVRGETKDFSMRRWGLIDYESEPQPFSSGEALLQEMGTPLFRSFASFQCLIDPAEIATIKAAAMGLEERLRHQGRRRINIDVGYLDLYKVVFASRYGGAAKIYHSAGIYLDLALLFAKEKCKILPWSDADLQNHFYDDIFLTLRQSYQKALKSTSP